MLLYLTFLNKIKNHNFYCCCIFQAFCDSSSDRSWSEALYSQPDRLGYPSGDRGTPGTPFSDPHTPSGTPFSDPLVTGVVFGGLVDLAGGGGGETTVTTVAVSSPHHHLPHSPAQFVGGLARTTTFPTAAATEFYYDERSGETLLHGSNDGAAARFWAAGAGGGGILPPTAGMDQVPTYLDPVQGGWSVAERPIGGGNEVDRYLNGGGDTIGGGGLLYGNSPCLQPAEDRPPSRTSLRSSSSVDSTAEENGGGVLHHHHHHHNHFVSTHARPFHVGNGVLADNSHLDGHHQHHQQQQHQQQQQPGRSFTPPDHCFSNFIE